MPLPPLFSAQLMNATQHWWCSLEAFPCNRGLILPKVFSSGCDRAGVKKQRCNTQIQIPQVIGVGAGVLGDMSSRPNWGLNELDFVFSTIVVGSIMNFSLMYLLAPTAAAAGGAAAGGSLLQRALSEQTLKNWGCPGELAPWSVRLAARPCTLRTKFSSACW